eukprot:Amastigsp_a4248_16.p1 type:complete len:231 gc:universal Amastigsp_a4248_16:107-799(+)
MAATQPATGRVIERALERAKGRIVEFEQVFFQGARHWPSPAEILEMGMLPVYFEYEELCELVAESHVVLPLAAPEAFDWSNTHEVHVFTDGSCFGNGSRGAVAGYGVWFGSGDPRNISEPLDGPATNNRAELMAVVRAIQAVPASVAKLHIHLDSSYVRQGITAWIQKWRRNNWRTVDGEPVKNQDLWQTLDAVVNARRSGIAFHYIEAHAGHEGNEGADALAKAGARKR